MTEPAASIRLRYPGCCAICSVEMPRGTNAVWDRATRTVTCLDCAESCSEDAPPPAAPSGEAGASAQRRHDVLSANREARVREAHPRLGGLILALSEDPQTTRAWARGADGERRVAAALAKLGDDKVVSLHDRRIPGTRTNIDHVVVAAAGVVVIDAKRYKGKVEIRDKGGWLRSDRRLYVGGRDHSELARAVTRQAESVATALHDSDLGPPIIPVLCFVGAEWPLISRTDVFEDVRLESPRSIGKLLSQPGPLDTAAIGAVVTALAHAFPNA